MKWAGVWPATCQALTSGPRRPPRHTCPGHSTTAVGRTTSRSPWRAPRPAPTCRSSSALMADGSPRADPQPGSWGRLIAHWRHLPPACEAAPRDAPRARVAPQFAPCGAPALSAAPKRMHPASRGIAMALTWGRDQGTPAATQPLCSAGRLSGNALGTLMLPADGLPRGVAVRPNALPPIGCPVPTQLWPPLRCRHPLPRPSAVRHIHTARAHCSGHRMHRCRLQSQQPPLPMRQLWAACLPPAHLCACASPRTPLLFAALGLSAGLHHVMPHPAHPHHSLRLRAALAAVIPRSRPTQPPRVLRTCSNINSTRHMPPRAHRRHHSLRAGPQPSPPPPLSRAPNARRALSHKRS